MKSPFLKKLIPRTQESKQASSPTHVLIAGGSVEEWASFTEGQWQRRLDDLVELARLGGSHFVTVHPHEGSTTGVRRTADHTHFTGTAIRREIVRDGVRVVIDPVVDGRERIVRVVESWPRARRLTERRLSRALFEGAGEPDLVIVLGSEDRLPSSLVWELAYGELVFLRVAWSDLDVEHLRTAVEEFGVRQRRFGGVE